jgi:hypothetical protein
METVDTSLFKLYRPLTHTKGMSQARKEWELTQFLCCWRTLLGSIGMALERAHLDLKHSPDSGIFRVRQKLLSIASFPGLLFGSWVFADPSVFTLPLLLGCLITLFKVRQWYQSCVRSNHSGCRLQKSLAITNRKVGHMG